MNRVIQPSELIISDNGHIYHIDLHPDDIADTIITVGDPKRVERVSARFDKIDIIRKKREFVTHTGWIGKKRISVISTGIGPDNIDIVINELDALVNIDLLTRQEKEAKQVLNFIRLGTSGCVQPGVAPGSLIISAFGLGMDNLMHFYGYREEGDTKELYEALEQFDFPFQTKPYLVKSSDYLREKLGKDMLQGITVTSPGFYGPQGRELRLKSQIGAYVDQMQDFEHAGWKITNFEMETSAIFGLSNMLGHNALSCNVVLANRADKTFSDDPKGIVEHMIDEMIGKIAAL